MLLPLLTATAVACSSGAGPTAPERSQPRIASVIVRPDRVSLAPNESVRFTADVRDADGRPVSAPITWKATGGDIDADGTYVGGERSGEFQVRAITIGDVLGWARIRIEGGSDEGGGSDAGGSTSDTGSDDGSTGGQSGSGSGGGAQGGDPADPKPTTLTISPGEITLETGEGAQFTADLRDQNGDPMSEPVSWEATGGAITNLGLYSAGGRPGGYHVTAKSRGLTVTADVTIEAVPRATTIRVSPTSTELEPGESQRFSAEVLDQNGDPLDTEPAWDATGGTISSSGRYEAGSEEGDFRVTVRSEGLETSADVTISAPHDDANRRDGVPISPGESIQRAVDANPAGTTFVLEAGIHRGQSVEPKDGTTFVGENGAVLDGDGQEFAFHGDADDVTIRNLVIEDYAPGAQMGAIKAGGHDPGASTSGWVVENSEVRHNDGGGIRIGDRMTIRDSRIHHNSQIGIVGIGDGVLVENNEIDHNNWQKEYDYGWEAGGTKFVKTRNLVVRGNHVHDNWGPGLWTDIDNVDTLYENNLVEDNADTGIFHEISYSAVIRNNTVRRNGYDRVGDWVYGAGILVAHSSDVEVYGNTVENNQNGIMGVQQDRGSGDFGPHRLENLDVHDNTIVQTTRQWAAGVAQDVGDDSVFDRNIRFDWNHYTLGSADGRWFEWADGQRDKDDWVDEYRNDVNGTFEW
ncbi:MAG: right-handed parallel beta-helix repeat-containing protein [Gemmatimonadota bacterium]|nr:right-handed parallel beta-helix repeat-containing protein [Gemmatimonadota bacterium]